MDVQFLYQPSASLGVIHLSPHEAVQVKVGCLVSLTRGVDLSTHILDRVKSGSGALSPESGTQIIYKAPQEGAELRVAPSLPGDIVLLEMERGGWFFQTDSFLAAEMSISLTAPPETNFFATLEGIPMERATGQGKLLVSAYGAAYPVELEGGQVYTVKARNLIAFTGQMDFLLHPLGDFQTPFLNEEGLVVDLTGPGKAWVQTRSINQSDLSARYSRRNSAG